MIYFLYCCGHSLPSPDARPDSSPAKEKKNSSKEKTQKESDEISLHRIVHTMQYCEN